MTDPQHRERYHPLARECLMPGWAWAHSDSQGTLDCFDTITIRKDTQ